MNYEAKLIFLRKLAARIETERLALIASPIDRNTTAFDRLMDRVAHWEQQLIQFQKTVKADLHGAGLRTQWGRSGNYSDRQSFHSKASNAQTLRAAAALVSTAIAELLAALDPDSVAWRELINSFEKIVKEAGEDMTLDPIKTQELQQIVERAAPGSSPPSPGAPGGVVGTSFLHSLWHYLWC